ncbi:hypothetical protein [Tannerella sp.]|uniref:hypothetical protein n=1 Tax=Tannerella sp. TaxID=2382127 RepID=UPI0026DC27C1|nr:hypothetical protein [Tannerella sp.]MDO4703666.1 hypothetical protein [Tannerella sp.]
MVIRFFAITRLTKNNPPNAFHIMDILTYLTLFHAIDNTRLFEKRLIARFD